GEVAGRDQRDERGNRDRDGRSNLRGMADQEAARDRAHREGGDDPHAASTDQEGVASSCSTRWSETSASSRSRSVNVCVLNRTSSKRSVSAAAAPALTRSLRMDLDRNSLAVSSRVRTISTFANASSIRAYARRIALRGSRSDSSAAIDAR